MPRGGVQTSLVGLINTLAAPFRRQSAPQFTTTPPTPGKGAPIYSYAWGQNPGYATNTQAPMDITRFAPVFQPSGGLFAPGYPLVPVDYERTRRLNFPVGINYVYTPRSFEPIGFPELKALATDDITRLCIETRKDQIEKLSWVIKPRDEKDVARNAKTRIQQLTEFWEYPDGITPFATWLRQLMDQVLVADCPALEPRRNRGGDLIALDIIEGSTIKVLIDDTGRRPRPPAPAYQQIIHGRPWVMLQDGSRTNTEEGDIVGEFTDQELIYFPRNPRADHLYGFSPVEQIVLTINTSIRRGVMQLQHFTIGNVPPGMVNAPNGWTGEQIAQFQEWFDSKFSGNTGERTKLLWGPEGAKYQAIKEAPLKDDFDEWRARVICFAFSLPPTAFTKQVNRATAETAQEAALEEGLAPLMNWVKRLVDGIIQRRQGHPDLEFAWSDVSPVSPKEQADMLVELTGAGLQTLNEARDQLGLDPVEGGDEILFKTATGPVTLDSVLNPPEPPPMLTPMSTPDGPAPNGTPGTPGQHGQNPAAEQGKPPAKNGKRPPKPGPGGEQGAKPGGKAPKPGEKPAVQPKTEAGKVAVGLQPLGLIRGDQFSRVSAAEIDAAAAEAHPSPSAAQIEAGNYPKGHVWLRGLNISIENARGSERTGIGADGSSWSVTMPAHYGYIRLTEGADGEHIDVYLGPDPESDRVWVVDQVDATTGQFDEHKVMLGYPSLGAALRDYCAAFSDGRGPDRIGAVHQISFAGFKAWLEGGDTSAPLGREVGKAADSPFGKRRRAQPGSANRRNTALLEATRTRLQAKLEHFFAERARDVAAQLAREMRLPGWESLGKLAKEFDEAQHPRDEHGRFTDGGDEKTIYHYTTAESAEAIRAGGGHIAVGDGMVGRAAYFTENPTGERTINNAERLSFQVAPDANVVELKGTGSAVDRWLEENGTSEQYRNADVAGALAHAGVDAIRLTRPSGEVWWLLGHDQSKFSLKAAKAAPWRMITGIVAKAAGGTISQEEADYTEDGPIEAERCRHCTMFRPPDSCTLVEGDIHPAGHCRFFEAQ